MGALIPIVTGLVVLLFVKVVRKVRNVTAKQKQVIVKINKEEITEYVENKSEVGTETKVCELSEFNQVAYTNELKNDTYVLINIYFKVINRVLKPKTEVIELTANEYSVV